MGAVLVLVIVLVVALLAILVVAGLRRRDLGTAIGELSRETRRRDASTKRAAGEGASSPGRPSSKEVERAAVVEWRGGAVEPVRAAPPAPFVPPDPETIGISRRQFFNRSIIGLMSFSLAGFGAAVLAYLWPRVSGGFGSAIRVGTVDEVKAQIAAGNGFYYRPDGRMWITEYPSGSIEKARAVYSDAELAGMQHGLIALYQKCPHLGCRVPECATSQWFECGCHGSQFNQVGEKRGGPAPRGMDRFAMSVDGDVFVVDTGMVIPGPPIGVNTTGQEAEGPHCVGGGGGH